MPLNAIDMWDIHFVASPSRKTVEVRKYDSRAQNGDVLLATFSAAMAISLAEGLFLAAQGADSKPYSEVPRDDAPVRENLLRDLVEACNGILEVPSAMTVYDSDCAFCGNQIRTRPHNPDCPWKRMEALVFEAEACLKLSSKGK